MVFLRGLVGYWACMNGLALGYVINSPASELQHVFFSPSRFSDSLGSLLGISKRPSDPIVPPGLEDWIQEQRRISFGYLLDNIAPNGANAKDAAPGSVIASPSKHAPNYYYQWVRDAAITMGDVVEAYANSGDEKYKHIIDAYADIQGALQNTFNPSGGYTTGGLGEPKFQVDGAPFTENWARPQRDGPALRALTLISYLRALNESDPSAVDNQWLSRLYDAKLPTNSIIKADLEYISHTWNMTGFDLWEEITDLHFFTAIVQRKALVEGRDLAHALNDPEAAHWYDSQQLALKDFLARSFWNKKEGRLNAYLESPFRSGADCALLLGALHGGQEDLFPPWADEILASLEALASDFSTRYPVNQMTPPFYREEERLRGVGIGRYPEDRYDGVGLSEGHPWFLCTSSASNVLYNTIERYVEQGYFEINDINLRFFNHIRDGKAIKGKYTMGDYAFGDYLVDMFKYADSFLNVIRWHATSDGHLSEQFNRYSGFQRGAKQLTWSHGSYLGAAIDRDAAMDALQESGVVA